MFSLRRSYRPAPSRPAACRRSVSVRPALEALEERTLLDSATFEVRSFPWNAYQALESTTVLGSALLSDDRVLVFGAIAQVSSGKPYVFARYTADGKIDSARYGNVAHLKTNTLAVEDTAKGLVVYPDEKMIYAIHDSFPAGPTTLMQFFQNHHTDTAYGQNGRVYAPFASPHYSFTAQADRKIVIVGVVSHQPNSADPALAVVRYAHDGKNDTSFGTFGRSETPGFGNGAELARPWVVVQPDGKIVVVALWTDQARRGLALARFNADGRPDASFGTEGRTTVEVPLDVSASRVSFVVQADGKIVVGGEIGVDFGLVRLNVNGTLDTGFGTGGRVVTDIQGTDRLRALVVQADGKLVAAGSAATDFALARYNVDGSLDQTFGAGGKVRTDLGTEGDRAASLLVTPGGKLVAVGNTVNDFALARFNADGTLDGGFGTGGKAVTPFYSHSIASTDEQPTAVAVLPNGKYVLVGNVQRGPLSAFTMEQFQGQEFVFPSLGYKVVPYAPGFGVNTRVVAAAFTAAGIAVQPDHKILAAGSLGGKLAVARYHEDGTLDTAFGGGGRATVSFLDAAGIPGEAAGANVYLVAGGKLLVTGSCQGAFVLARLNADGSPDTTFGSGGRSGTCGLTAGHLGRRTTFRSGLQPDGKLVVLTTVATAAGSEPTLTRYGVDGSLDTSFSGGRVDLGDATATPFDLVVLPDGKLLLGANQRQTQTLLVRFAADGRLDPSFGTGGKALRDFKAIATGSNQAGVTGSKLLLHSDGKIILVGSLRSFVSLNGVLVARFMPDGSPSFAFGTNGHYSPREIGMVSVATALLQPDGKLVVAGTTGGGSFSYDMAFARFQITNTDPIETRNEYFVSQVYQFLLERRAEPAGLSAYAGLLDRGELTRAQVVERITLSPEYQRVTVRGLYRTLLNRTVNPDDADPYVRMLAGGGPVAQVKAAMLGTLAGTNDGFLEDAYRRVLGRPPDPAGRQVFLQLLASGTSRENVARRIVESRENLERIIRGWYRTYLRREADEGGLNGFVNALKAGEREETIIGVILSSAEFTS